MATTLINVARIAVLACIPVLGGLAGCEASRAAAPDTSAPRDGNGELTLRVEGMACDACASRLETSLRKLEGVENASVDFARKRAHISFDPARTNVETILEEVDDLGFEGSLDDKS